MKSSIIDSFPIYASVFEENRTGNQTERKKHFSDAKQDIFN